jgi:DNA-binding transcriptional LysR family regulator
MERAGVRANIAMRAESIEAVKNAVREGTGIGMLYRDTLRSEIATGEITLIHVAGLDMCVGSFIIYPRQERLSTSAAEFLNLLREQCREPRVAMSCERRVRVATR